MKKIVFALCCSLIIVTGGYSQNKLDKSKNELNQQKDLNTAAPQSSSSSSGNGGDGDGSILLELLGKIALFTVGMSTVGHYGVENHLHNELTEYPFYISEHGNYFDPFLHENGNINNFRFDVKDKFLYNNGNLFGNHLEAKLRPFQYFYIKADYYQLFEFQEHSSDNLSLFYFNLGYDRIRLKRFNLGWTLGASYIANDVNKFGFSFGANAEYFCKRNISFLAGAKWSFINEKPVNAFEIEGRFHRKNYFISVGFEHLDIATPNYNFATLGGGIYL
ncbi:hypothetical protein FUA48_03500 [Flavobacterium alkalisoli]|uniref:Uncharacterized protein n=1 Tax=Flavobacterium alkalisoli TaxID=2602769 RepID=A0A5B9FVJ9_9FLAO|nr:hypothetical protein [Flavobacterium alkalisoli]QEE48667.1 hypothetical protein FUA48_03500 [Flavobacterium alkalisoli]